MDKTSKIDKFLKESIQSYHIIAFPMMNKMYQ